MPCRTDGYSGSDHVNCIAMKADRLGKENDAQAVFCRLGRFL